MESAPRNPLRAYFDFACALADDYTVLDRGKVVLQGTSSEVSPEAVRNHMMV